MSDATWTPWTPLPNMRGEFSLERLIDDEDGLHLTLSNDTGRTIRLDFRSAVAHRLTGRAVAPPEWRSDPVFSGQTDSFFFSESSAWATEAARWDTGGGEAPLRHFLVALPDEIIEVLTDEEPNAAWENTLFGDAV